MNSSTRLHVLVVEPKPLTRFAIQQVVDLHPCLHAASEATDATTARQRCCDERPDLIVLNLDVPRGDGIELLREFPRLHQQVRTVVATEREDALSVRRAFRAGAIGYVTLSEGPTELLMALECGIAGQRFASARVSHALLGEFDKSGPQQQMKQVGALSDRELYIFRKLGRGEGPKAIASQLGLSVKTIETHQQRIREKLRLVTNAELRRAAARWLALLGFDGRSKSTLPAI